MCVFDADVEDTVVVSLWCDFAVQELPDLQLQVGVGVLQAAHLCQVGGQAVVEVLHGGLLADRDVKGIRQVEATAGSTSSRGGEGGLGDTDSRPSGSSVHAAGPHAAEEAGGGGRHDGAPHGGGDVAAAAGEGRHD